MVMVPVLSDRLAVIDRLAQQALDDADPWRGFAGFLDGLFSMQHRTAASTTRWPEIRSAPSMSRGNVAAPGGCWQPSWIGLANQECSEPISAPTTSRH